MITSEQITDMVNAVLCRADKADSHIAQLQYDIQQLRIHQTALKDKLHYLQLRIDNPSAEPNQYDAVGEHRADKILSNPIMDRQEYPKGMREWEIVEFKALSNEWLDMYETKNKTGFCNLQELDQTGMRLEGMMQHVKEGTHAIHSVRRLSDGEVFTVGDKTDRGVIKSFSIINEALFVFGDHWDTLLRVLNKEKAQSFTTADGTHVLEGYNIWFMHPERHPVPTPCKAEKGLNWSNHYSTKEAAEAAYKAAVLFETADGQPIFNEETEVWSWNDMNIFSWQLKYLLDPARPWYSTLASAEAAYNKWLYEQPVLCLNDIKAIKSMKDWEQIVKDKLAKS
jgi:hypothetical protein